ncbi:YqhG family protein [Aquibacillus koreensis]|uniref:YqhG family protein n=1 Tax=Aquibacillus koreensis TaxID=279446 RepID=A0A9X4AGS8_9BACI|nr:YqhG family protein [Aquibacillus koreensis]MCT2537543.1 YqhG family protein [Aquibacillus koreensis]MDC3418989.1 YqhG family protein [Aquibacillus koreensis]
MTLVNLHDFLNDYFTSNHCEILENNNGKLHIQLTDKMDELLMNRPFYWQYVKKLGYPGEPMKISFITNPNRREEEGEWIHFGSPRLHQIFRALQTQGKFTKLYEHVQSGQRTALVPWLVTNLKISYSGKQKKDEIVSIGLQLINGAMNLNMMQDLDTISLKPKISDFSYTMTPIIRMKSGYQRILNYVEQELQNKDHIWAEESWNHLQSEKKLLEHFYQDTTEDEEYENRFEQELKDIESLYKPVIDISVINGGLFYLTQQTSNKLFLSR